MQAFPSDFGKEATLNVACDNRHDCFSRTNADMFHSSPGVSCGMKTSCVNGSSSMLSHDHINDAQWRDSKDGRRRRFSTGDQPDQITQVFLLAVCILSLASERIRIKSYVSTTEDCVHPVNVSC